MGLREDLLAIAQLEYDRQRYAAKVNADRDDALLSHPAHILRAEDIISGISDRTREHAHAHNFLFNKIVEVEIMRLLKSDYRQPKTILLRDTEKYEYYSNPINLRGAAQLVHLHLVREKIQSFFMQTGFRPGHDDSGYSLYISINL